METKRFHYLLLLSDSKKSELNNMPFHLIGLLQKAVRKVPFMKYAFAVIALAATAAIVKGLKIKNVGFPIVTFLLILGLLILIVIFSVLVSRKNSLTQLAGIILMYATLLFAIISVGLLLTAVFYDYPKPILQILNLERKDSATIPNESTSPESDLVISDSVSLNHESIIPDSNTNRKEKVAAQQEHVVSRSITVKPTATSEKDVSPYRNKCFSINLIAGGCIAFRNRPLTVEETKLVNAECATTNDCQVRFYPNMNKKACLRKKLLDEATVIRFIANNERVVLLSDISESYLKIKDTNGIEGYISSQFYDAVTIKECNNESITKNKNFN